MGVGAPPIVTAAMAVGSAVQQVQQQRAAGQSAKAQARYARQVAAVEAGRTRAYSERLQAAQRARLAASGVTVEGSPLIGLESVAADGKLDELDALSAGENRANSRLAQRERGVDNLRSLYQSGESIWGAGTSLLRGQPRLARYQSGF